MTDSLALPQTPQLETFCVFDFTAPNGS